MKRLLNFLKISFVCCTSMSTKKLVNAFWFLNNATGFNSLAPVDKCDEVTCVATNKIMTDLISDCELNAGRI